MSKLVSNGEVQLSTLDLRTYRKQQRPAHWQIAHPESESAKISKPHRTDNTYPL